MTEAGRRAGDGLRLARQARGLSQQQLAGMARVSRQAVSAVESGHSEPSLRVALALASALGVMVEDLFGPGEPAAPVAAVPLADEPGPGTRVALAPVGDTLVALPLSGDARTGFMAAGGQVRGPRRADGMVAITPIGPPRPTLVVAGCDPALPLLETPLALLDPPVAFAWWPCGNAEALEAAARGIVHAAGVHASDRTAGDIGFTAWREGLVLRPELAGQVRDLADVARRGLRLVNREPGAQARSLLDRERTRLGIDEAELTGYDSRATGHLQVASAVAAGIADAGVASEPAARAYGCAFLPLADERFDLVLPAAHVGSREVQALLRALTSPWLRAQLASLPGYRAGSCGDRVTRP